MPRGERCHPAGSGAGAAPGSGGCEPCTRVCTGVRTRAAPTPRPRLWVQEGFCCPRSREKMWVRCRGVPSATPATPPWLAMGCWTVPSLHPGHGVLGTLSPVRAAPSSLPAPAAVTNPPEGSTGRAGGCRPSASQPCVPRFPTCPHGHRLPQHAGAVLLTLALQDKVTGAAACRGQGHRCPAAERSPRPPGGAFWGAVMPPATGGRVPGEDTKWVTLPPAGVPLGCTAGSRPCLYRLVLGTPTRPWGHHLFLGTCKRGTPTPACGPQPKAPVLHPLPSPKGAGTTGSGWDMGLSWGGKRTFPGWFMSRR